MRVRQYAYLMVRSDSVPLPDITAHLGIEPDKVRRMGSRQAGPPPMPRTNLWMVTSRRPDTALLDEHFDALLAALEPHTERIRAFLDSGEADGTIQVVRYFSAGEEDDDVLAPYEGPAGAERLPGQYPLLSFHLGHDLISFATRAHLVFDFDEYGDEHE